MSSRDRDRGVRGIFRWLTVLALVAGFLSTLIYASGAHLAIRYFNPPLGEWWDAHQFAIMEVSATALGLLLAIRGAAQLMDDAETRRRAKILSLAISAIVALPLSQLVASLARLGWDAHSARVRNFLQALAGYEMGNIFAKLVMGGVYFVKSCAFSALAGLALFALAVVITMSLESSEPISEQREAPTP